MEDKLVVERKLLEWARKNDYPVNDRVWYEDAASVKQLEQEMAPQITPRNKLEEMIATGTKELDLLAIPTFERTIYTPSGMVEYLMNFDNENSSQKESYVRDAIKLGDGRIFTESLFMAHGPEIKNWRSDKVSKEARKNNADVGLYFFVGHPSEIIEEAELSPYCHDNFYGNRLIFDPNPKLIADRCGYPIAREGNDRLNRLVYALTRIPQKNISLPLEGKPANDENIAEMFRNMDILLATNSFE